MWFQDDPTSRMQSAGAASVANPGPQQAQEMVWQQEDEKEEVEKWKQVSVAATELEVA